MQEHLAELPPLDDPFRHIYEQDAWRAGSGTGSRPENNVDYIGFLSRFMFLNQVRTVVDLGCGDWQFSRFIDWSSVYYTGIDVVPSVINQNSEQFGRRNVAFRCIYDPNEIPEADLLICKDMFQHLPNAAVQQYLDTLRPRFKWLLITNDDYPQEHLNADIEPGHWRALRLGLPPFSEECISLLSWVIVSETPTVRKRLVLIRGTGGGVSGAMAEQAGRALPSQEIPRRIFQTWKVRAPLPTEYETWSKTIKQHNPGYEYVLWDDTDNRDFIKEEFEWFLPKYDSYQSEINRVDAVRYFVLYYFGGFYMDLDVECLASLDSYVFGQDVIFGRMGTDPNFSDSIPNAIMASRPRQEFWLFLFSHLLTGPSAGRVEAVTGPSFLKHCIDLWNEPARDRRARIESVRRQLSSDLGRSESTRAITILPPKEWYPIDWSDPVHQMLRRQVLGGASLSKEDKALLFSRSKLVTYWTHSWSDP